MSVFLSWSGADRDVKNVIAQRLDDAKIPFWESDEGCLSDFSAECIANIKKSRVFIVIISEASMDPHSYVFNEVRAAREMENDGQLNILVYRITDKPYTDRFEMQLNHITDTNHVARKRNMGALGGIDLLIRRVQYLLKCREEGRPEKPFDVYHPNIAGTKLIGAVGGYFVPESRNDIIQQIENSFERSNVVVLTELFGFGKKSVIRKYISTHKYQTAVEIYGSHESLYDFVLNKLSFANVNDAAFDLKDDNAIINKKIDLLNKLGKDEIIVISDVDLDDSVDQHILGLLRGLNCHVVVITQKISDMYEDHIPVIRVGRMKHEHLTELFFHHYDRMGMIKRDPLMPALSSFFNDVGGHTKTVEIAASVLKDKMKYDSGEVITYLTRGSEDKKELNDRIIDRLSELIEIKQFEDREQQTLLAISLIANPTISLLSLKDLLKSMNLFDDVMLSNLNKKRWITVDIYVGMAYIEPIIAQIFVSKFMDYDIITQCFDYLCSDILNSMHKDTFTLLCAYSRMESFLKLLDMNEAADIFKAIKSTSANNKDADKNNQIINVYTEWCDSQDADEVSPDAGYLLIKDVIEWIDAFVLPALKISYLTPLLFDIEKGASLSGEVLNELMDDIYGDSSFLDLTPDLFNSLSQFSNDNEDNELAPILTLCNNIQQAFFLKNTDIMIKALECLVNELENKPEKLENADLCAAIMVTVRILYGICINTGTYRAGITMIERLIPLGWSGYHLHRLLIMCAHFYLLMGENDNTALSLMESADEILGEILYSADVDREEIENLKKEHALLYTQILVENKMLYEAMDKFAEITNSNIDGIYSNVISLMNSIVDLICVERGVGSAISFVEENKDMLKRCVDNLSEDDGQIEQAESLFSMLEYNIHNDENPFTEGGEKLSQNYYQKYSVKKGNNLVDMMKYNRVADGVRRFDFSKYTNDQLKAHVEKLRERAQGGENRIKLAPEAFALVSEAGFRVLGYRHHKVQYVGAAVMLDGKIAEILNGEGKTYTITLTAFVNSLYSEKVFVLDNSQYLTERNYKWMRGVYSLLGLKVGLMPYFSRKDELKSQLYDSNIVYSSFHNYAFYILDAENNKKSAEIKTFLSNCSAIIDEADFILIESARVPFLLNKADVVKNPELVEKCSKAFEIAKVVYGDEEYYSVNVFGGVTLNQAINPLIEEKFGINVDSLEHSRELVGIEQIIRKAIYSFGLVNGKDYFVKNGRIRIENQENGTLRDIDIQSGYFIARFNDMPPAIINYYSNAISEQKTTMNLIHTYELLRRIGKISGTSATACSFKKAFWDIYKLEVLAIPTVLPVKRVDKSIGFYTRIEYKEDAIVKTIEFKHDMGQPILLIVRDVSQSLHYSALLRKRGIEHKLLNAANSESSPEMLANAGMPGSVLIATQLANRGVDIKLGGDAERMTLFDLVNGGYDLSKLDDILYTIPDEETKNTDLYRAYTATLEKNRVIVAANRQKVVEAGGLCVISSEPYLDMRIEQQIRGRAGRQGAVGESYVFECIDDPDMKVLSKKSDRLRTMIDAYEMTIIEAQFLLNIIENAKKTAHKNSFNFMVNALEASQRIDYTKSEFFRLLDGVQSSDTISEVINTWSENDQNRQLIYDAISNDISDSDHIIAKIYKKYGENIDLKSVNFDLSLYLVELANMLLSDPLVDSFSKIAIEHRLRGQFYQHLTRMHELEVDYNSTNKKNNKMLDQIYEIDRRKSISDAITKALGEIYLVANRTPEVPSARKSIRRAMNSLTTGRNDPCPCGSGKKYKYCCGSKNNDE